MNAQTKEYCFCSQNAIRKGEMLCAHYQRLTVLITVHVCPHMEVHVSHITHCLMELPLYYKTLSSVLDNGLAWRTDLLHSFHTFYRYEKSKLQQTCNM